MSLLKKILLEKVKTKKFTIVNERKLKEDLLAIQKAYAEKGFFLAKPSYKTEKLEKNQVRLIFLIDEGSKIQVGSVTIHGNKQFKDTQIIPAFLSQPVARQTQLSSAASIYSKEFVARDNEVLAYFYKDRGYAKAKSSKPNVKIDLDRQFVRIEFFVKEGLKYNVGEINFEGDLVYPEEKLEEFLTLTKGKFFRLLNFEKMWRL